MIQDKIDTYNDFYFVVFTSNPIKNRVKYEVDANNSISSVTTEKFVDFIRQTVGLKAVASVQKALRNVGETYLLDREEQKLFEVSRAASLPEEANFKKYQKIIKETKMLDTTMNVDWTQSVMKAAREMRTGKSFSNAQVRW